MQACSNHGRPNGCGSERTEGSLLLQVLRTDLEFPARVDVGRRRPGLEAFAHRPAGSEMDPLVELPFLVLPEAVDLGELQQFAAGDLVEAESMDELLSHTDFHLLEAELETLLTLEQEFGYLLPEQATRKDHLIDRLFIDPETLLDNDADMPDYPDFDDPPFWKN